MTWITLIAPLIEALLKAGPGIGQAISKGDKALAARRVREATDRAIVVAVAKERARQRRVELAEAKRKKGRADK